MELFEVFLIIFYCFIFYLLIVKTQLFSQSGLKPSFIILLFGLKLVFGFIYLYIHQINGWGDSIHYFSNAKRIFSLVPDHFGEYLRLVFTPVKEPFDSHLTQLLGMSNIGGYGQPREDFIIRLNALLMLFSGGSYYVQSLFFVWFSLIGIIYIYTFLKKNFIKNIENLKLFLFFAPILLFWLSGMHKDALSIVSLGFIVHFVEKSWHKISWTNIVFLLGSVFLLFLIRDYVFIIILLPLIGLLVSPMIKIKPLLSFTMLFLLAMVVAILQQYFYPEHNSIYSRLIDVRKVFITAEHGSQFASFDLEPNFWSFLFNAPKAFFNALVHPNLLESHSFLSALAGLENTFYLIIAGLIIIGIRKRVYNTRQQAILLFLLSFSISHLMFLGYVVTNSGALVRYKAIPTLFLGSALILLQNKTIFNYLNKSRNIWGQVEKMP